MTHATFPPARRLSSALLVVSLAYASAGAASCVTPRRVGPGMPPSDEVAALRLEVERLRAAQADADARAAAALRERDEAARAERERLEAERQAAIDAERERIQQALVEEIRRGNLSVLGTSEGVSISVADAILFDFGRVDLRPEARRTLDEVARVIGREAGRDVRVAGHTDDRPVRAGAPFRDNWDLSAMRAASVARYLIEKGVDPSRIRVVGYADRRPVAPNDSAENRQRNRRVEIVLIEPERLP